MRAKVLNIIKYLGGLRITHMHTPTNHIEDNKMSKKNPEEKEVPDDGTDIWVKPNGTEIRINREEATVKYAKELKWKKVK